VKILCSFGPSCERLASGGVCPTCNGRYCLRHSGHGTGHATQPKDWATCGHPLVDGKPLCEKS
jgi:hypothetical protein